MPSVINLNKSDCRNCHKCIRHCPVKAIRFSGNQAHIISSECILCGQCFVVCPQHAKEIIDDTEKVRVMLEGPSPVIASIDPTFYACWKDCGINTIRSALKQLGFTDCEETAVGAALVRGEFEKELASKKRNIIISSSCYSVNLLIEKHYPELTQYIAPVVSPMIAHAKDIKRRIPDAKVVYIGPCVSKKEEAEDTAVDAVLTFQDFDLMRLDANIDIPADIEDMESGRERATALEGGFLKCMKHPDDGYLYLTVSGVTNCITSLQDIKAGDIDNCFIEMSACPGGCIGGPIMERYINSPVRHICAVLKHVGKESFEVEPLEDGALAADYESKPVRRVYPTEDEIREILRKLGKESPADELNCGSCGYETCRDKAIAIFRGTANYSMCLPSIMERTQRFNDKVLNNMPSGVIVVNEDLEVQSLNKPALKLLNIGHESDVLSENIVSILDPAPFLNVLERGKPIKNQRSFFSDYDKYLEQTIVYDRSSHILIDIINDVTDEEEDKQRKSAIGRKTIQIADRVVENQMRIVQEIASLLGETTAETKIALTKLKESIGIYE